MAGNPLFEVLMCYIQYGDLKTTVHNLIMFDILHKTLMGIYQQPTHKLHGNKNI